MMRLDDAQYLIEYVKEIADGPKRGKLPQLPIPNDGARLRRLRQDPNYGPVLALLDRAVGL